MASKTTQRELKLSRGYLAIYDLRFACVTREIRINPMIDPSAVLRTHVRAGPNGVDRVLVDKERRVMETLSFTIDDL